LIDTPYEGTDTITAVCVFDYDFDKIKEVFIGNYSGLVICYKYNKESDEFKVEFSKGFYDPIMGLITIDIYNVKYRLMNRWVLSS